MGPQPAVAPAAGEVGSGPQAVFLPGAVTTTLLAGWALCIGAGKWAMKLFVQTPAGESTVVVPAGAHVGALKVGLEVRPLLQLCQRTEVAVAGRACY